MLSCDTTELPQFTTSLLAEQVRRTFRRLPDGRKGGNNQRCTLEDAALSAFSVFFTQSPSFLDYQKRMQKERGRNNAASLFGVHRIPSDQQIRNLLDPASPEEVERWRSTSSRHSTGAALWRPTGPVSTVFWWRWTAVGGGLRPQRRGANPR